MIIWMRQFNIKTAMHQGQVFFFNGSFYKKFRQTGKDALISCKQYDPACILIQPVHRVDIKGLGYPEAVC